MKSSHRTSSYSSALPYGVGDRFSVVLSFCLSRYELRKFNSSDTPRFLLGRLQYVHMGVPPPIIITYCNRPFLCFKKFVLRNKFEFASQFIINTLPGIRNTSGQVAVVILNDAQNDCQCEWFFSTEATPRSSFLSCGVLTFLQATMQGPRKRGRQRSEEEVTDSIANKRTRKSFAETQALAHDRHRWRQMVQNSSVQCPYDPGGLQVSRLRRASHAGDLLTGRWQFTGVRTWNLWNKTKYYNTINSIRQHI